MSFRAVALFKAKQGKLDEVLKLVIALRDHAVEKEPGTTMYLIHQDQEDDHKITIFEEYASKAALAEHQAQEPFRAFLKVADDVLDGGLTFNLLKAIP